MRERQTAIFSCKLHVSYIIIFTVVKGDLRYDPNNRLILTGYTYTEH